MGSQIRTGDVVSMLKVVPGVHLVVPSRILVLGPDSSLGPMIAAAIVPLVAANGDPKRAVAPASMLAIMVAGIMILAAVAKLGFIADLLSKPTMIGYINGLAQPGRSASERFPAVHHSRRSRVRPGVTGGRSARHRAGVAGRHHLHRIGVRCSRGRGSAWQPGNDRRGRRQPSGLLERF